VIGLESGVIVALTVRGGENMPLLPTEYLGAPICPKCGAVMIIVEECNAGVCIVACMYCDDPEPVEFLYEAICWKDGTPIDSRTCIKSNRPGGGWVCPTCGSDLWDWKVKMGLIPLYEGIIVKPHNSYYGHGGKNAY
jgi:hypothetical protein